MNTPEPNEAAANRVTIHTLAKALNLSVSTISRALSNHDAISDATKERVLQLAQQLGYQPNQLAAGLRRGRSNIIGVMVPYIKGHFFSSIVNGIEAVASKAGFNLMICQSNEDVRQETRNLETLINAQVEGLLVSLARTTRSYDHFERVHKRKLPLVFFDRCLAGIEVNAVLLDDYQAAYQLVKHLAAQGNRRIAHFVGPQHLNIWKNRYHGYLDALRDSGLAFHRELVYECDMNSEAGAAGMRELLQLPTRPDAVFAASGSTAVGIIQVLKEHGLRIPEDVAVAGYSNEVYTTMTEPMLTSVDQRCERMGQAATQMLLDMVAARTTPTLPRRLVLQPKLLVRASTEYQRRY